MKHFHFNVKTAKVKMYIALFLSLFCLLSLSVPQTFAQTTSDNSQYLNTNTDPTVPKNLNTLTQSTLINVLEAVACSISGINPLSPSIPCLGVNIKTGQLSYATNSTGLTGVMTGGIAVLFNNPIHTTQYISYLKENFGLAHHTYAQTAGTGFNGLSPFISIWSQFRNIVYLFFVVILVITGLGIMLRLKLDPKAVMTVESQIPKMIIGLLLVTFSFAIAGLMIDIMNILLYVLVNVFVTADPTILRANVYSNLNQVPYGFADKILTGGIGQIVTQAAGFVAAITANVITQLITSNTILSTIAGIFNLSCVFQIFSITPGTSFFDPNRFQQCINNNINGVVVIIADIIIYCAIVVAMIRLWFALLKAYIFFLIHVMLGPFYIALGLIPGSPLGFGYWMREMLGNLAAFPVTLVMFLLGKVFVDSITQNAGNTIFVPPFIGNYLGGSNNTNATQFLGAAVGLGIILMMPQAIKIAQDIFKSKGIGYASAIGQSVTGGQAVVGGVSGAIGATAAGVGRYGLRGAEGRDEGFIFQHLSPWLKKRLGDYNRYKRP